MAKSSVTENLMARNPRKGSSIRFSSEMSLIIPRDRSFEPERGSMRIRRETSYAMALIVRSRDLRSSSMSAPLGMDMSMLTPFGFRTILMTPRFSSIQKGLDFSLSAMRRARSSTGLKVTRSRSIGTLPSSISRIQPPTR